MSNRLLRILFQFKYHLNWENNDNLCWLNSSMSLLAHNKTLQSFIFDNRSQIATIVKNYEKTITFFNDYSNDNEDRFNERRQRSKQILHEIQTIVLDYLKPILKYKDGEPDSAFCCLLNLIKENEHIKNLFLVEYFCIRNCRNCAFSKVSEFKKTIITLQKVPEFNPASPMSLYQCHICKSEDQTLEIKYKTLPRCLIFHLENVPQVLPPDTFEINNRKYELSGFIELKTILNVGHFATWIRDIATNSWLEHNDLKGDYTYFCQYQGNIQHQGLYIAMYEALDNNKTISCASTHDSANISRVILDHTSSSCTNEVQILDDEECEQNNQTEKKASNLPFIGSLYEQDETYCHNNNKEMSKRPDNNLNMEEPIEAAEDCLQDKDGASVENNFEKNLKDSISMLKQEENKFIFTNVVAAFFAKLENSGETLVNMSNTDIQEIHIKEKVDGFEKKDIPSNKDISVDSNIVMEESNLNMNEPINNAAEDCLEDETCASASAITCSQESKKKFVSNKKSFNLKTNLKRLKRRTRRVKKICHICNECAKSTGRARPKYLRKIKKN